jgi:exonuclease SbcC
MKIHSLKLFNIASLAGSHTIDFDRITDTSNIFAITGKTGSGKSSLLNAISLALYGNVYKTTTNSSDYITLGKDIGEIDITYSAGFIKYKASWKLRIRKKNGELLKKPQLTRAFFKFQESQLVPIESAPEDILGLSFNQFCKTSILNQGEFSRFLNSKFTERKEILD